MLHVGFAETDITPKLGSQSPGGMQARRLNEVHDPLKAVAMVIKSEQGDRRPGRHRLALHHRGNDGAARETITRRDQDPRGERVDRGQPHARRRADRDAASNRRRTPSISNWSPARIAEAVGSAYRSLHAAELGDGIGHEPSISFNRRFLMRDGRQVTHPGKGKPGHRQAGRADRSRTSACSRPARPVASCWDCSSTSPATSPSWEETDSRPITFITCERP